MALIKQDIDITRKIKMIEGLKSQLLMDVAQLFEYMTNQGCKTKEENTDLFADMIIITYLLAKKMGISYESVDRKVLNKIKLNIIQGKDPDLWVEDLSNLSNHLAKKRNMSER